MDTEKLKTSTRDHHTLAERAPFSRMLLTGEYTEQQWIDYLSNLFWCYRAVEQRLPIIDAWGYRRSPLLYRDLNFKTGKVLSSTYEYVNRVDALDQTLVMAHMYVRWLGDLNGGHLIAKKCPYAHSYLEWEDQDLAKLKIKQVLSPIQDQLIDESKIVFSFAEKLHYEILL
jgi:heme oxygenase